MSHGQRVSIYGITGIAHGRATNLPVLDPSGNLVYLDAPEKYASLLEMEPSVAPTGEAREAGYVVVGNVQSFHHRGEYARLYKAPGTHAVPFPYRRYSPWLPKLCGGGGSDVELPTDARRARQLGYSDTGIVGAFLRGFRRDADKVLTPSWRELSAGEVADSLNGVGFAGAALLMLRFESFAELGKELSQEEAQERIAKKESDLKSAQGEEERINGEIIELGAKIEERQPQLRKQQDIVSAATQAVQSAQTDLEEKKAARETALQRQKDLAEQEADEDALKNAQNELDATEEDVEVAKDALEEAQAQRNATKEVQILLTVQIVQNKKKLQDLNAQLQNAQAAREEAQADLEKLNSQNEKGSAAENFLNETFENLSRTHVSLLTDGKTGPASTEPFRLQHGSPEYVGRAKVAEVHRELSEPFYQVAASLALDIAGRDVDDIKFAGSAAATQQKLAAKEGLDFLRGGIVDDERALVRVSGEVVARFATSRGANTEAVDAASYDNRFIAAQSLQTKTALLRLESQVLRLLDFGMRADELVKVPSS